MTDRELLQKAAKAYFGERCVFGIVTKAQADAGEFWVNGSIWNPLTDDGDALRLAVKLGLTINPYKRGVFVSRDELEPVIREEWGDDDATITRRAITRAAAAMAGDTPATNGTGEAGK